MRTTSIRNDVVRNSLRRNTPTWHKHAHKCGRCGNKQGSLRQVLSYNILGQGKKEDLRWASHHNANELRGNHELHEQLLEMIREEMARRKLDVCKVKGYTSYSTTFDDVKVVFQASPFCHGGPWYDWGYVKYVVQLKQNGPVRATYPSKNS